MSSTKLNNTDQQALSAPAEKGSSLWRDAWHRLQKNKMALLGLAVMITMCNVHRRHPHTVDYRLRL